MGKFMIFFLPFYFPHCFGALPVFRCELLLFVGNSLLGLGWAERALRFWLGMEIEIF
jgi:hypothetical protein